MEAGEGGRMVGIKKEGREAKRRRIAAGEEGIFRGEKRPFHPSSGVPEREERGRKGTKKLYLIEA